MADEDTRPAKRIRQACEPCRRKKARCSGDKPQCSFCQRLNQPCKYSEEVAASSSEPPQWAEEMEKLNQKINTIITHLATPIPVRHDPTSQSLSTPTNALSPYALDSGHVVSIATPFSSSSRCYANKLPEQRPPLITIIHGANLYADRCHCQPLPLLRVQQLRERAETYSWEVIYAILAMALRYSDDPIYSHDYTRLSREHSEKSIEIVMEKVTEGKVDLSTLQALCLLSFIDLIDGNTQRAWTNIGLGIHLGHSAQLETDVTETLSSEVAEARRNCFWSLHLIRWMLSRGQHANLSLADIKLGYPSSTPKPFSDLLPEGTMTNLGGSAIPDLGIMAYTLKLADIWQETLRYSKTRLDTTTKPPWHLGSGHCGVICRLMHFETILHESHRFVTGRFSEQGSSSLRNHTSYWGPWLLAQFTFHTISCLLYHPFIVSQEMTVRGTRFPFTYIDNCAALVMLHANWIDIFISLINENNFPVSDPFVAYCAAVSATVHLWYLYVDDEAVKEQARLKFKRCYRFVSQMATRWPIIQKMANNLQILNRRVAGWPPRSLFTPSDYPLADKSLIWAILTYVSDEDKVGKDKKPLFHASLDPLVVFNPAMERSTTTALSSELPYTGITENTLRDDVATPEFISVQGPSSILDGGNDAMTLTGTFQSQPSSFQNANYRIASYERFGSYEWSGMGNL